MDNVTEALALSTDGSIFGGPDKGQHQVHYFGYYPHKSRGLRQRRGPAEIHRPAMRNDERELEPGSEFCRKHRKTWAPLIQCVYEVAPLKCAKYGGTMKVISFIEKCLPGLAEKILRYCGFRIDAPQRPPPRGQRRMMCFCVELTTGACFRCPGTVYWRIALTRRRVRSRDSDSRIGPFACRVASNYISSSGAAIY